MAPKGKKGDSRMDAAISAMAQLGFTAKEVRAKMRELLKVYAGHYAFIEQDAYRMLLEVLLADQKDKYQCGQNQESELRKTSMAMPPVLAPPAKAQPQRRTKPCYGFIDDDDDAEG